MNTISAWLNENLATFFFTKLLSSAFEDVRFTLLSSAFEEDLSKLLKKYGVDFEGGIFIIMKKFQFFDTLEDVDSLQISI